MKILSLHNYYKIPGGEDVVFETETALLERNGHQVIKFIKRNDDPSIQYSASHALSAIWNHQSYREVLACIREHQPDIVHSHNFFTQLSPALFYACKRAGVPVVQALDNQRLLCPAATFYRDGHACTDCVGRPVAWPGIVHGCYRQSRAATASVAGMVAIHRFARTWQRRIDSYLVSTEFFRRVFIEGGLPPEKLRVRPHCVLEDPGARSSADGGYALFVGRLATEKGVGLLIRAWQELKGIPLRIRGEGPLSTAVETFASTTDHTRSVQLVGRLSRSAMYDLIRGARVLIVPSFGLYETFALVVIEAFACGTPVIVSNLGATAELVADGQTGLHFDAGSHEDLARKVAWAWAHPRELEKMGRAGRRAYERRHSGEAGYTRLIEIYESVLRARS